MGVTRRASVPLSYGGTFYKAVSRYYFVKFQTAQYKAQMLGARIRRMRRTFLYAAKTEEAAERRNGLFTSVKENIPLSGPDLFSLARAVFSPRVHSLNHRLVGFSAAGRFFRHVTSRYFMKVVSALDRSEV